MCWAYRVDTGMDLSQMVGGVRIPKERIYPSDVIERVTYSPLVSMVQELETKKKRLDNSKNRLDDILSDLYMELSTDDWLQFVHNCRIVMYQWSPEDIHFSNFHDMKNHFDTLIMMLTDKFGEGTRKITEWSQNISYKWMIEEEGGELYGITVSITAEEYGCKLVKRIRKVPAKIIQQEAKEEEYWEIDCDKQS